MSDESWFPLLIKISSSGEELVIPTANRIPKGVRFRVIATQYYQ
jgi:hypothetical protein